jgi:hypothetical protein
LNVPQIIETLYPRTRHLPSLRAHAENQSLLIQGTLNTHRGDKGNTDFSVETGSVRRRLLPKMTDGRDSGRIYSQFAYLFDRHFRARSIIVSH